jgi:hypothetical protein
MSVQAIVAGNSRAIFDLEQQLAELLALRRALCRLNAASRCPKGSRRRRRDIRMARLRGRVR